MLIEIYLPFDTFIKKLKKIGKDLTWQMENNPGFKGDRYMFILKKDNPIEVNHPDARLSNLLKRIIQGNI